MGCRMREVKYAAVSGILALLIVSIVVYTVEYPGTSGPHLSENQDYSTELNVVTEKDESNSKEEKKEEKETFNPNQKEEQPSSNSIQEISTDLLNDNNLEKPIVPPKQLVEEVKSDVKENATPSEHATTDVPNVFNNTDKEQLVNTTVNKNLTRYLYSPGHLVSIPERCPNLGAQVSLLVMVATAPDHASRRMAIRQTWGTVGQRTDVSLVFIIGITTKLEVAATVSQEQGIYGDIAQGNFTDTYRTLTLKSISMLEWANTYCPHAKFLLKVDDDVYVNTPKLLDFLNSQKNSNRTIFGGMIYGSIPYRDENHKWYVPRYEFSGDVYPNYLIGLGYLITGDVFRELYDTALDTVFLSMEDVFTNGVVAEACGINKIDIEHFYRFNVDYPLEVCSVKKYLLIAEISNHDQYYLWTKINNEGSNCQS